MNTINLTPAEILAARWNATYPPGTRKWKCGLFNLAEFGSHCGETERGILIQWLQNPLFL